MPHAHFDDNFADHPKNAALSDAAFRLHVAGVLYCARHLSDGLIPADEVPRLTRRHKRPALVELLERGHWRPVGQSAYEVHDYLDHNDSRAVVLKRRATAAARKAKWLAAREAREDGQ